MVGTDLVFDVPVEIVKANEQLKIATRRDRVIMTVGLPDRG